MLLQLKDTEAVEILSILRSELMRRRNFINISEQYDAACSILGEKSSPEVAALIKRYSNSIEELEELIQNVEVELYGTTNSLPF